jgi:Sensors of blue-light using FAD
MTPSLQVIVYVSTAIAPFSDWQLENLLIEARDLNLQNGITGVLLYSEGNFMQCFEGAPEPMRKTYDRIRASRRHTGLIELLNEPMDTRTFPDWQLGFAQSSRSDLLLMSRARWQQMSDTPHSAAAHHHGLVLLQNFWNREQI